MSRRCTFLAILVAAVLVSACGGKSSGAGPAVCGNGDREPGEECDAADLGGATCASLGLQDGSLACEADCTFDVAQCTGQPVCGDGTRQYPEQCDATDLAGAVCTDFGYDGGDLACTANCTFDTAGCTGTPPCGDGLVAPGEQCDGNNLSGQTCASLGLGTGTLTCGDDCRFDLTGCSGGPTCGDGVAEVTEACDGTDLRNSTCVDAGFDGGDLACETDCTFDVSGCWIVGTCGNGLLDTGEACDGTDFGTATCASLGHDGGWLLCTNACAIDESACLDCTTSDTDPPVASNHLPAPETQGYSATGAVAVDLTDACGIDTSTIVMTIAITPPFGPSQLLSVTPTVTGSGASVSLSWTPTTPLPAGAIVEVTLVVDDVNANTLTETWRYSVVQTMTLVTAGPGGTATVNQLDETNPDDNIFNPGGDFVVGGAAPDRQRLIIRFVNNIPAGALVLDALLYLARCPGSFAPTTIECYGMRADSAAISSTWNLRLEGPPGPSAPWGSPGADAVPADHTGTLGASVNLPNSSQPYVWETGPAMVLATEWSQGNGTEQQGMLCINADPTVTNICPPISNGPPKMDVTFGPALP